MSKPIQWRTKKVTVAEAEASHLVHDERLGPLPVPFGWSHKEWLQLLDAMQPGDELWEFCSPKESWRKRMGRSGLVLVRDGEEVATIMGRMN
jgi:hypothetical protein